MSKLLALSGRVLMTALILTLGWTGAARADAKADILAAHQAMVAFGKFRSTGTTESKRGKVEMLAEVEWPNRFHTRTDQTEVIVLPGQTYMKTGGRWERFPMDMSAMIKGLTPDAMKQSYDNMTNVVALGREEVNGVTANVYEYDTSATIMGIRAQSHVKLWIDAATKRVVRQEVRGTAMGTSSVTVQNYEYPEDLSVKAPL
jgi:outer membrane lipoprotein-sorting protein